jgi:hypothetical protein
VNSIGANRCSSYSSLQNKHEVVVDCFVLGDRVQHIIEACPIHQPKGYLEPIVSGQVFDVEGWNVIVDRGDC